MLGHSKGDIFHNRAIGQIDTLWPTGHGSVPARQAVGMGWGVQIKSIRQQRATARWKQTHQNIHQGAFATTRASDQADTLTATDLHIQTLQHLRQLRCVAKSTA